MLFAIITYCFFKAKTRRGDFWSKYGPVILVMMSLPLIMADPLRHVLQDADLWQAPSSSEYRSDCHDETFRCLSALGVFFTVVFTYMGFAFLITGTMWNANLCDKLRQIRSEWQAIRAEHSGS